MCETVPDAVLGWLVSRDFAAASDSQTRARLSDGARHDAHGSRAAVLSLQVEEVAVTAVPLPDVRRSAQLHR